ncbi:hypothetical protein ACJ41O_003860 [Fusarium nematophilum]
MILSLATAALLLLEISVLRSEYIPAHKRFSYDATVDGSSHHSLLSRRDTCSDAFGSGAQNSVCAPDFTLCCTRSGQDYPSCERHLGKGWCCIAERDEGNCYVDQESVCDDDGSVLCTNLQEGTSEACCPKLTTCDPDVEASEAYVRCNIDRGDLLANGKAEQDTAVSGSETSSTTAPHVSTTTAHKAQPTDPTTSSPAASSSGSSSSSSLSGGAIGGVVVGAVAGAIGMAGLLFWLLRRRKTAEDESTNALPQQMKPRHHQQENLDQQGGYMYGQPQAPAELMDQQRPVEMDAESGHRQR